MEATHNTPELMDADRQPRRAPTLSDVRKAYYTVRALDNANATDQQTGQSLPVIRMFSHSGRAKACAVRLISELKPYVEASDEELQDLLAQHCEINDGHRQEPHDIHAYRKAERAMLSAPVPELQDLVDRLAIRASVVGTKHVMSAPTGMLDDLGPFFIWDLTDEELESAADGAANRSERRR